jgi:hypothetical protein
MLVKLVLPRNPLFLSLRSLLGALFLVCGIRLCLFLRRLLLRGFRRFVTHKPKIKVHTN